MKKKTDLLYLQHINEASETISVYLNSISFEKFLEDKEKQDAVIRQIEIIGEATKRLSPELLAKYPNFPWSQAARMRDKLIHDYFEVDLETVWVTAAEDVPNYQVIIRQVLSELE